MRWYIKYYQSFYFHWKGTSRGVYLYVESSAPAQSNDNAKLISPWLNPVSGGQCLKFYYNMYGSTTGELMVRIEPEGKKSYLLFYEKGNKGMGWKGVTKDIEAGVRYRVSCVLYKGICSLFLIISFRAWSDHVANPTIIWIASGTTSSEASWEKRKATPIISTGPLTPPPSPPPSPLLPPPSLAFLSHTGFQV